jgi:hypothetical protein
MFWYVVVGLAVVGAVAFGILFARQNPRKADRVASGVAAAGQKAEDLAKQVVTPVQGK